MTQNLKNHTRYVPLFHFVLSTMILVFLALAVFGGLWMPVTMYPPFMQTLAQLLPSFHLAQVSLAVVGTGPDVTALAHVAIAAGMTAILALLALWRWSRQP